MRFISLAVLAASMWSVAAQNEPPIACNMKALSSVERKQLGDWGEHVIRAITASRELTDGFAFRVDPGKATLTDVARWLEVWRRCCPFYEFQIDYHAADASVWLAVKGRPGVKEYIPVDAPRLAAKIGR
jgi:hypothetical protein